MAEARTLDAAIEANLKSVGHTAGSRHPNRCPTRVFVAPGFLAYSTAHDNRVMGIRFEANRLQTIGAPVALL